LDTPRLGARVALRPLTQSDSPTLVQLANDRTIADTMISVPHPFTANDARALIAAARDVANQYFGVHLRAGDSLVGVAAMRDIDREHAQGELSFWIGRPYWGQGLASDAGATLLHYAFGDLDLNRVVAYHMLRNPASGQVLAKLGFQREGVLRQRVRKWGVVEDVAALALLRHEYEAANR
jgi:RimJ/RimL family protein N-acetyltransferase